jgi:hypothetical protein
MMHHNGLRAGVLAALLALAFSASAAATEGFNLSVAEGELGRVRASAASLTFTDEGGMARVICEVQTTLTLNATVLNVEGAAAGQVREIAVRTCSGGRVTPLTGALPWSVTYRGFTGTLPSIEALLLRVAGASFLSEALAGFARCLYRGNLDLATVRGASVTELRVNEATTLPLSATLGAGCAASGVVRGSLRVAPTVRVQNAEHRLDVEPRDQRIAAGDFILLRLRSAGLDNVVNRIVLSNGADFRLDTRRLGIGGPPWTIARNDERDFKVEAESSAASGARTNVDITYETNRVVRTTVAVS